MSPEETQRRQRRGVWIGLLTTLACFAAAATALGWAVAGLRHWLA